jgi:hypothetical protein
VFIMIVRISNIMYITLKQCSQLSKDHVLSPGLIVDQTHANWNNYVSSQVESHMRGSHMVAQLVGA